MTRAQEEAPPSCVLMASFKKRKRRSTGKLLEAVLQRYLETQGKSRALAHDLEQVKMHASWKRTCCGLSLRDWEDAFCLLTISPKERLLNNFF